jgi:hypothetical protein
MDIKMHELHEQTCYLVCRTTSAAMLHAGSITTCRTTLIGRYILVNYTTCRTGLKDVLHAGNVKACRATLRGRYIPVNIAACTTFR